MTQVIRKAYVFRLYPDEDQKVLFEKTFGSKRWMYNRILTDFYQSGKITTPAKYKKEFSWLKEVDSLALANAQMDFKDALSRYKSGQNKKPAVKKKGKCRFSYSTNSEKSTPTRPTMASG